MPIRFTDPPGDEDLVNHDPLALLIAMLLDQQVPITWAFAGPARIVERLGEPLDARHIATLSPETFEALAAQKPAIHRYHRSMAHRIQALCAAIVSNYDGDAAGVWAGVGSAAQVAARLEALPGFGPEKAQITVAVLAKRLGQSYPDVADGAGAFADNEPRSVADIDGPDALAAVKAWKKRQRDAGRAKTDPS